MPVSILTLDRLHRYVRINGLSEDPKPLQSVQVLLPNTDYIFVSGCGAGGGGGGGHATADNGGGGGAGAMSLLNQPIPMIISSVAGGGLNRIDKAILQAACVQRVVGGTPIGADGATGDSSFIGLYSQDVQVGVIEISGGGGGQSGQATAGGAGGQARTAAFIPGIAAPANTQGDDPVALPYLEFIRLGGGGAGGGTAAQGKRGGISNTIHAPGIPTGGFRGGGGGACHWGSGRIFEQSPFGSLNINQGYGGGGTGGGGPSDNPRTGNLGSPGFVEIFWYVGARR